MKNECKHLKQQSRGCTQRLHLLEGIIIFGWLCHVKCVAFDRLLELVKVQTAKGLHHRGNSNHCLDHSSVSIHDYSINEAEGMYRRCCTAEECPADAFIEHELPVGHPVRVKEEQLLWEGHTLTKELALLWQTCQAATHQ